LNPFGNECEQRICNKCWNEIVTPVEDRYEHVCQFYNKVEIFPETYRGKIPIIVGSQREPFITGWFKEKEDAQKMLKATSLYNDYDNAVDIKNFAGNSRKGDDVKVMQKLVTVYLHDRQEWDVSSQGYAYTEECCKSGHCDKKNLTREHLSQYLEDGWVVKSIDVLGGASSGNAIGWLVILLEKWVG
jgi:hypothetical protein